MNEKKPDRRRQIPPVDRLLASDAFTRLRETRSPALLRRALRDVQAEVRARIVADEGGTAESAARSSPSPSPGPASANWYADAVARRIADLDRPQLRGVINATGVVLHTNLGRAPLAAAARDALVRVAAGYSNLEYDLERGGRGSRYDHCVALLRELTGAEDALVLNNNAAALVLALNTVALGRDALISRGELVEIGGSFRVAEIMERSGARIREVGSTNRTHAADYEAAVDGAAAILKVHRSNFRMSGFTSEVQIAQLAALAHRAGVPLVADQGS
ncbi:MAG: L-seryl-tRNA(Sec) selenium transferase, partial [Longimicrobiales bacterium]